MHVLCKLHRLFRSCRFAPPLAPLNNDFAALAHMTFYIYSLSLTYTHTHTSAAGYNEKERESDRHVMMVEKIVQ
jgi:hypothetical protein